MELNELEKIRVEKLEKMRAQGVEPYPTRSDVAQQVSEAVAAFTAFEKANPETAYTEKSALGGQAALHPRTWANWLSRTWKTAAGASN